MREEFTPGDWTADELTLVDSKGFSILEVSAMGYNKKMLDAAGGDDPNAYITRTEAEVLANLRLIRNAPMVLKALNTLVEKFTSFPDMQKLGITKEINQGLDAIIAATVPSKEEEIKIQETTKYPLV